MKCCIVIIAFLLNFNSELLFSQSKSVLLKWVDWEIVTDAKVECHVFESSFDYDCKLVKCSEIIDTVQCFLIKHERDFLKDGETPDVRIKIEIEIGDKNSIICLSESEMSINGSPIVFQRDFFVYIIKIIDEFEKEMKSITPV